MSFSLKILGTASALPVSDKNPSAQVLSVHGRLFLIDCGEGTQRSIRSNHLAFTKIEAIFISHIHGDHVFGLFGLLSSLKMVNSPRTVKIFGPGALQPILRFYQSYFDTEGEVNYEFHEVKVKGLETIYESKGLKVSAFPLNHKIECYGYRFDEVLSEHSLAKRPAASYAYCSDTAPFPELPEYVRGVSALYHETTYPMEYAQKASVYFHSSTEDAARCALKAGVGKLIVGHYSARERDAKVYEAECRRIFPNSFAPVDGDEIEIE